MKENRIIVLPVFKALVSPVARKPWKCDLCKQPVEVGKRYAHYYNRKPHEIKKYHFHSECFAIVLAYCKAKEKTSFTPKTVANWIRKEQCEKCASNNGNCNIKDCMRIKVATGYLKEK